MIELKWKMDSSITGTRTETESFPDTEEGWKEAAVRILENISHGARMVSLKKSRKKKEMS
jgi:hypothetical protein